MSKSNKATKAVETVAKAALGLVEGVEGGDMVRLPLAKCYYETDTSSVSYDPRIEAPVPAWLVASVKRDGVLQPIQVRITPEGYCIVNGKQRFRAAQAAGLILIPAVVLTATEMTPVEHLRLQVKLNAQTIADDLAAQTANVKRMGAAGLSVEDIAEAMVKPVDTIKSIIGIDEAATPEVKALINDGTLALGPAQVVARAAPEVQVEVAKKVKTLKAQAAAAPQGKTSAVTGSRKADAKVEVHAETGVVTTTVSTEAVKALRAATETEQGKAPTVKPRKVAAQVKATEADLRRVYQRAQVALHGFPKPEQLADNGFVQGVLFAMRFALGEDYSLPATGPVKVREAHKSLFGAVEAPVAAATEAAA
jgi:ParB/RepB/Spo0J family partition protein